MRKTVTAFSLLLALAVVLVAPARATGPAPGTYHSIDLGGAVQLGRVTVSWFGLTSNGAGDVFNMRSWDGTNLGAQWYFQCGFQGGAALVDDNRVAGTGNVVRTNTYLGGNFFLDGAGPWSDGTKDLFGILGVTRIIVTERWVNGVLEESRMNIDTDGMFNGSNCTLTFVIANGLGEGDTNTGPLPADYPDFLDPNCNAGRFYGSWGSMSQITMRIDCPVPSRKSTWGALKQTYR
jgi:hypothetical protein